MPPLLRPTHHSSLTCADCLYEVAIPNSICSVGITTLVPPLSPAPSQHNRGLNNYGQLGLGDSIKRCFPCHVPLPPGESGEVPSIVEIQAVGSSSSALSKEVRKSIRPHWSKCGTNEVPSVMRYLLLHTSTYQRMLGI
jgi:hypothetical protein